MLCEKKTPRHAIVLSCKRKLSLHSKKDCLLGGVSVVVLWTVTEVKRAAQNHVTTTLILLVDGLSLFGMNASDLHHNTTTTPSHLRMKVHN